MADWQSEQAGSGEEDRTSEASLERVKQGNARFLGSVGASPDPAAAAAALAVADPYAVVLGCSDSRVPPEIVFNEAPGRLFVVRVVAHVPGAAEIGSIEYAVARWGCPLVVVLGHTQCAGIAAVLDRLPAGAEASPAGLSSMNLTSLLSAIKSNLGWFSPASSDDPWLEAVRLNVRKTMQSLSTWSATLRERAAAGQLAIVGAVYHVESGQVELLDQPA
jgi:carbonic anhydrase